MKLHLGCGEKYLNGWVNVDIVNFHKLDVQHDLNKYPYPFKKDQFKLIYSNGLVEHLHDPLKHFNELHRISKNGGIIQFKVPFYNSQNWGNDFTHVRPFGLCTANFMCDNVPSRMKYIKGKFILVERTLTHGRIGKLLPNFINLKLCNVIGEVFQLMEFKMVVIK